MQFSVKPTGLEGFCCFSCKRKKFQGCGINKWSFMVATCFVTERSKNKIMLHTTWVLAEIGRRVWSLYNPHLWAHAYLSWWLSFSFRYIQSLVPVVHTHGENWQCLTSFFAEDQEHLFSWLRNTKFFLSPTSLILEYCAFHGLYIYMCALSQKKR